MIENELTRFVCWKHSELGRIFEADAGEQASYPGVFAATHQPASAIKRIGQAEQSVDDVAEDALRELTISDEGDDPIIVPVIGEPGTGKSHLVRWAWTRLEAAKRKDLVTIYLSRVPTSVAGVVERLLAAALQDPDPDVRRMAQSLVDHSSAIASQDRMTVAVQLKTGMYTMLRGRERETDLPPQQIHDLAAVALEGGGLAERLAADDFALGRRALRFINAEHGDGDGRDDPGFSVAELRALVDASRGASQACNEAIRRLVVNEVYGEGSIERSCRVLNWALDGAVSAQVNDATAGRPSIGTVFRKLRESLRRAGKELVVLVEDLKLLHGVERNLLEMLIDPTDAIGMEPACRVRALVACTEGPWESILADAGTLKSRLQAWRRPTYLLTLPDIRRSEDEISDQLALLAAGYLNAARLGVSELEAAYQALGDDQRGNWAVASACMTCPKREPCHQIFGAVQPVEGNPVGLYPLNRRAILRSQEAVQSGSRPLSEQINPRALLTQVLHPTLSVGASAIERTEFPVPQLAVEVGIPPAPEVAQQLKAQGYPDSAIARAATLIRLWGEHQDDIASIGSGITESFGMPHPDPVRLDPMEGLDWGGDELHEESRPADRTLQELHGWLAGATLPQVTSRAIRNAVHGLAIERVDWADIGGARSERLLAEVGLAQAEYSVAIEGAVVGEGQPPPETCRFTIGRSEPTFNALAAVSRWTRSKSFKHAQGGMQLVEIAAFGGSLRDAVMERASAGGQSRDSDIASSEPGFRALLATTVTLGLPNADSGDPRLLAAALLSPTPAVAPLTSAASRLEKLRGVAANGIRRHQQDRLFAQSEPVGREEARKWLLRRVALRQSAAAQERQGVHMIDAGRLMDAVRLAAADQTIASVETLDPEPAFGRATFIRLAEAFDNSIADALSEEHVRLRKWVKLVGRHVDLGEPAGWYESVAATIAAVNSAITHLGESGLQPSGSTASDAKEAWGALVSVLQPIGRDAARELLTAVSELTRIDMLETTRRMIVLVSGRLEERQPVLAAITDLVSKADVYLDHAQNYIKSKDTVQEDPIVAHFPEEYRQSLVEALAALRRIDNAGDSS